MKSKDSDIIRSVAGAALKVMIGEEPDSQEFDQELKKTQTKASKKKTPEEEAGVAKAAVQAVKVEDVNVFDLPLDTMSEEDVASLKSLTQEAMDAVPLSQEQSNLIDKINVIREKYNMTLLQSLNNKKQIGEDKKELKKVSKELAGASKMHKSQSERIKKILPDVKSVDEAHGELHGGQKKLDMNKNNKVDAEDFKMLRAKKKPAKRTVTIDKPDRLVSMKVSKEAVEYVNEVEVLPKGVTRHKAKLAMGAKYGASDYGRGGEEEQTMKKAMTRKSEPKKRGSYGARQNIVRGTKVSGKDVNESASFFDKLTMLEEAPLEAISVALKEGRMKDMVTGHMDKGHSYDDAVKKAQADLDKMKKPKQMSVPLNKQKANEEYVEEKNKQLEEGTPTKKQVKQGIGIARDKRYAKGDMSGAVKAMDKVNKGLAQHPAVAKELRKQNEDIEQIDELSPKTLGSYAKKAQRQTMNTNMAIGANPSDNPVTRREKAFAKKRKEGASRAIGKLVQKKMSNEEYEQLDELSPKTLGSYSQKSVRDLEKRDKAMGKATQRDREVVNPETSKPFQKMAKRRSGLTKAINRLSKEEVEQLDELSPKTLGDYATKAGGDLSRRSYKAGVSTIATDRPGGSDKDMKKIANRTTGLARAARKLVDKGRKMKGGVPESVEHIDELDTKTLMSYRDKAEDDQVDRAMDMKGNTPKARKRAMGIEKAKGRLQMKAQLYGGRPGQSSYKGGHLNPVKKEEVEYIVEKNVPNNPKLWSRAKSLAKQKFDVYPSAYANGWAARWYKSKGGTWRKGK